MRLYILSSGYPNPEGGVHCGFVHARCLEYLKRGVDVRVFIYYGEPREYVIDGLAVKCAPMEEIFSIIARDMPDACAIHFPVREFCEAYSRHQPSMPFGLWFHGVETLSWKRRLFNFDYGLGFLRYIFDNTRQLCTLRNFLASNASNHLVRPVYVSEWMHKIAEADLQLKIPQYWIIPNPIDCGHFSYQPKPPEQCLRVLLLRSFSSRKYANDLSVEAIRTLARRSPEIFSKMHFAIYGTGPLFRPLTSQLRDYPNVRCEERLFPRAEIPGIHRDYGIFLCPTRQDAQGVSMCEAMASGLVPVTSRNTAIPEFVEHRQSGLLAQNTEGITDALEGIAQDSGLFAKLSSGAADRARRQCDAALIARQELNVLGLES